jgi:hypothetical protein
MPTARSPAMASPPRSAAPKQRRRDPMLRCVALEMAILIDADRTTDAILAEAVVLERWLATGELPTKPQPVRLGATPVDITTGTRMLPLPEE